MCQDKEQFSQLQIIIAFETVMVQLYGHSPFNKPLPTPGQDIHVL